MRGIWYAARGVNEKGKNILLGLKRNQQLNEEREKKRKPKQFLPKNTSGKVLITQQKISFQKKGKKKERNPRKWHMASSAGAKLKFRNISLYLLKSRTRAQQTSPSDKLSAC